MKRTIKATVTVNPPNVVPNVTRVFVSDPHHPHHGEAGVFTGNVIRLFGKPMAELRLENCQHGTDGCFVKVGQVRLEQRQGGRP
jgi:hypothetical protein